MTDIALQLTLQRLADETAAAARIQARAALTAALLNNTEFVREVANGLVHFDMGRPSAPRRRRRPEASSYALRPSAVKDLELAVDRLMEHVVMKGLK